MLHLVIRVILWVLALSALGYGALSINQSDPSQEPGESVVHLSFAWVAAAFGAMLSAFLLFAELL